MLNTEKLIRERLSTLNYTMLEIVDIGKGHEGHTHANQGHYHVHIASPAFHGKSLVVQHQMVYQAIGDLMKTSIHALRIDIRES